MSGISKVYFESIDGQLHFASELTYTAGGETRVSKVSKPVSKFGDIFSHITDDYNIGSRHIASGFGGDRVHDLYREIFSMYRTSVRNATTIMKEHEAVRELTKNPDFIAAIKALNAAGNRFASKNGATFIAHQGE